MNVLISGQAQIWGENLRERETFPLKFLLQQRKKVSINPALKSLINTLCLNFSFHILNNVTL